MSIGVKFLAASALALALSAPVRAADLTADTVVANVNGQSITLAHMIALRDSLPADYQALPDDVLFNGILDQLIQQTALAQIGAEKMTRRDEAMLEVDRRAYLASAVLDQTADTAVTEEGVRAAYDARFAKAEPTREYNASHILVETEEEAKAIKAELDGGADFAETARTKSTGPSGPNDGELGWFPLEAMVKPFGDAVAALKPAEISVPVQSEFGWHIIRLNDTRLAEAPKLDDVRAELEGDLRAKAVEARLDEVVQAAKVERRAEGIDPAVLKNAALLDN